MKKYIILTTQRTGSNFLATKISGHSDVQYLGEVFRETGKMQEVPFSYYSFKRKDFSSRLKSIFSKNTLANEYLDFVFDYGEKEIVGYKLMVEELRKFPELKNALLNRDIAFLKLKRKNILKRLISFQMAMKNKKWLFKKGEEVKVKTLTLDTKKLISELEENEREEAVIDGFGNNEKSIELYYENITTDTEEISKVLKFIGANVDEDSTLETYLKKQTDDDLTKVIENYAEVESCLSGTKYAKFLKADSLA